ncbi:MAG: serine/threonine-protein kinase [Verrucomicrobiota bacterium]
MSDGERDFAKCHSCRSAMDVTEAAPFSRVVCPNCGEENRVKREFGPYKLTRRHAVGGMSLVFVAEDKTLDREVILKILNEDFSADEKRIAAFEEEARITAAIGHPQVVRVFTTGRAFGRFFIAMEFVPGGHFERHIRDRGSIPEEEALPLMIQVAEGLSAAHHAGLIHRDIKPGNILLDSHGKAKIVDFGLALITQGGTATAEEIWATPYYVPPETIEGLPEDFRSDVYAFGATFHHALAGKPPCNEETMDTNRLREAKKNTPPLHTVAPEVSDATCAVVDHCMAHDPDKRFASYEELIAALKGAQQQLGGHVESGAAGRRKQRKQGQGLKLGLGIAALLLMALLAFVLSRGKDEPPADESPVAEQEIVSPDPVPTTDSGAGLRVATAYRAAVEALRKGDYDRAREQFVAVRDDPEVLEPTGSWAACEVVVASFLNGRSEQARQDAQLALKHVRSADGLPEGIPMILENVLGKIPLASPIKPLGDFDDADGAHYMSWWLSGLKNWEQGCPEDALPFFRAVSEVSATGSEVWLEPYIKLAGDYLSDAERLKEAELGSFVRTDGDYASLIDELQALRTTLRTKGRARFNVRCWQQELRRQEKMSSKQPEQVVRRDPGNGYPKSVEQDLKACQFGKAVVKLKSWQPEGDEERKQQLAMLTLAEAAAAFLSELGERAVGFEGPEVLCRNGRKFAGINGTDAGRVWLKTAAGADVSVDWEEIEPDSLIAWHRALSRQDGSEIERLRRHELAVAFDLLAGDAERGREAGSRLAQSSEAFERRWSELQPALER